MSTTRRYPAVAGMYYEAKPDALRARIEWSFRHELGPGMVPRVSGERRRETVGYLVPHAGYMFSGPIAAHAYYHMALEGMAETYIIVGPNHSGLGSIVSVYPSGIWVTPLGEIDVDEELSRAIVSSSSYADVDTKAHLYEHSIEVQLPFLQYLFNKGFKIVAIAMWDQSPEVASDLAHAISDAVKRLDRDAVLVATSNLTQYEPYNSVVEKDSALIGAIKSLDPSKLLRVVEERSISICGLGPILVLIQYARLAGASRVEVFKYATSGDVTGDKSSVVGYVSLRVY